VKFLKIYLSDVHVMMQPALTYLLPYLLTCLLTWCVDQRWL